MPGSGVIVRGPRFGCKSAGFTPGFVKPGCGRAEQFALPAGQLFRRKLVGGGGRMGQQHRGGAGADQPKKITAAESVVLRTTMTGAVAFSHADVLAVGRANCTRNLAESIAAETSGRNGRTDS